MDIWIEKLQISRVLNEVCTQLGMLRCKIYVVIFLGGTQHLEPLLLEYKFKKHKNNTLSKNQKSRIPCMEETLGTSDT